ncbi:MAG: hypothetical protein R3B40_31635 [Polyangiales bacterium]
MPLTPAQMAREEVMAAYTQGHGCAVGPRRRQPDGMTLPGIDLQARS